MGPLLIVFFRDLRCHSLDHFIRQRRQLRDKNMKKLDRSALWSLEEYAEMRSDFKTKVIAHKQNRQLPIGPNATVYFEDS